MASKTLSYYADEGTATWMQEQVAAEGRSTSQIIGDALRFYRGLPEEARRALRVACCQGREDDAFRAAARAILLTQEAANRKAIAKALLASGRALPDGEDALVEEAARLAG